MKLINILKKDFLLPLFICFILSICLTLFVCLYYSSRFGEEPFQYHIKKGKDQSISFVLTLAQELLYERFQLVFDYLITLRKVLEIFHTYEPELKEDYLISLGQLVVREENKKIEENLMVWFINKEISDLSYFRTYDIEENHNSKKYIQYKYLYMFSSLVPFLKGFYNNFKGKESFSIDSFIIMNRKTEIFTSYPVKEHYKYNQIYDYESLSKNQRNCRNKDRRTPKDYYIFCGESFRNIEEIYKKNPNRRMFITYPYEKQESNIEENKYIISLCYMFNFTDNTDIVEDDIYKKALNDEIIICADINIESIYKLLDNFQTEIYGYFFIAITQNKFPMYYPGMTEDPYFNDITRFEFNYSLSGFSILNVTNFNTITLPKLIKEYNPNTDILTPTNKKKDIQSFFRDERHYYTVKIPKNESTFQKGQKDFQYFIYPIFFGNYYYNSHDQEDNTEKREGEKEKVKEHVLSLVYIINEDDFNQQFQALFPYVKFLSILYCIIFVLIGTIILNCSSCGVFIISSNIIKPINDIKSRLQAGLTKKNNNLKGIKNKNEFTYQGININKLISLGLIGKKNIDLNLKKKQELNEEINYEFDRNSNDIFGRYILGNESLLNGNDNINTEEEENNEYLFQENEDNLLNENNQNINNEQNDDDDEDGDDDDEIFLVKNSEINNQFNLLLDLKKINIFMKGPQVNSKDSNVIKFISCDSVFREIKNKLGENICLSNIGNLENINKRYDKSILFLSKSLGLDENEGDKNDNDIINNKEILESVDNMFEKDEKPKIKGIEDFNRIKKDSQSLRKTFVEKNNNNNTNNNQNNIYSNINNIEFIRFMKLFYAYKMYFSNVRKIEKILNKTLHTTKSNNNDGNIKKSYTYIYVKSILFYFNDYFISNAIHIHKKYKKAIYVCLQRLIESKDITRKKEKIIYCYTELFSYYISYLKIRLKRTINEINENYIENDFSSLGKNHIDFDKLKSNKLNDNKKYFNKIVNIAKKLKEYLKKMDSKLIGKTGSISEMEKNKYKEFLNELKNVNKKNYNIQFNIFLMKQGYNYLFAKLSKLCGDYAMAISYYLKVIEEQRLISNGFLYIKANIKICNIINFANNNPQFLTIQEKDEKFMKELLQKCSNNLENKKKTDYKDLIILLDRNYNIIDDEKKYRLQIEQYKTIITIFEKYLSLNDRFAFYIFGNDNNFEYNDKENEDIYINYIKNNSIKKLISLTYKNNKNYSFIKGIIDKFHDDIINYYDNQAKIKQMYLGWNKDDVNKNSFNENSILKEKIKNNNNNIDIYKLKLKYVINSIFKVINDFTVNNHDEDRKKFIILITESFQSEQNNNISSSKIKSLFKDLNDNFKVNLENLFIIGTSLEEQNQFKLISNELLNYGIKNEYLEFENIQEMNKKFYTMGKFPRKYEYPNENLNKEDNK